MKIASKIRKELTRRANGDARALLAWDAYITFLEACPKVTQGSVTHLILWRSEYPQYEHEKWNRKRLSPEDNTQACALRLTAEPDNQELKDEHANASRAEKFEDVDVDVDADDETPSLEEDPEAPEDDEVEETVDPCFQRPTVTAPISFDEFGVQIVSLKEDVRRPAIAPAPCETPGRVVETAQPIVKPIAPPEPIAPIESPVVEDPRGEEAIKRAEKFLGAPAAPLPLRAISDPYLPSFRQILGITRDQIVEWLKTPEITHKFGERIIYDKMWITPDSVVDKFEKDRASIISNYEQEIPACNSRLKITSIAISVNSAAQMGARSQE